MRKKIVVEQAIFLLISFLHLSPTFIKSYLILIAITVTVVTLHLAFYSFCQFYNTINGNKAIIRSRIKGNQKDW